MRASTAVGVRGRTCAPRFIPLAAAAGGGGGSRCGSPWGAHPKDSGTRELGRTWTSLEPTRANWSTMITRRLCTPALIRYNTHTHTPQPHGQAIAAQQATTTTATPWKARA